MNSKEFITALRLRLGCPIFPSSPSSIRYPCGQIIDVYGDHVLGCGFGPLRIKRHDALCEVIFHNLLIDSPGVLREQHCSFSKGDRPGDVYHLDFVHGKPAFFYVSVRNSFTETFVNNCSFQAGAAAETGEMAKDLRHDANVTASGGVFYPLVVESFGTWSVHSLEVLKTIARKTSLSQTLTISRAVCNLHELLSIRLWQYNARMILDRLHVSKDCFLD